MKKTNIIIVLVIVAALGYYYSTTKKSAEVAPAPAPSEEISANPAPEAQALDVTIDINDMAFSPAALDIAIGAKVTWVNNDAVAHTITSDVDGIIDSPTIDPGQTYKFTFTRAGTVSYHCNIHPTMQASVTVK